MQAVAIRISYGLHVLMESKTDEFQTRPFLL